MGARASSRGSRVALLAVLEQTPSEAPQREQRSDSDVLAAATKALGSNSRTWSVFRQGAKELEKRLVGYDPRVAARSEVEGLLPFFPGFTGRRDARAVVRWGNSLIDEPGYWSYLLDLWSGLLVTVQESRLVLQRAEELPLLAVLIGREGRRPINGVPRKKAPGMGPVLATEFLKNLGWSGFKPDRHVKRLFLRWCPDALADHEARARELGGRGRTT